VTLDVPTRDAMLALGARLATLVRAGDVVLLDGPLGAGKTTLTQGIGAGLGIATPITSPTFVLAREHTGPGVRLVHVDAYRLASWDELDDLDLDTTGAVTVVEWGRGLAEPLAADRLEVTITPAADDVRRVTLHGRGARWDQVDLSRAVAPARP
jgi:tRNA threonylcarbamoyladenosine biosynthesis protein TsaE